jgi:hypothetical protein
MRHPFPQFSLITTPRNYCPDDAEVQAFLADELLNFKSEPKTGLQLLFDAHCRFGEERCASIAIWLH